MYQDYAANLVETAGKNGSVITDYQYEQNNYIDNQLYKEGFSMIFILENPSDLTYKITHSPFLFEPTRLITPLSLIACKVLFTVESEHFKRCAI